MPQGAEKRKRTRKRSPARVGELRPRERAGQHMLVVSQGMTRKNKTGQRGEQSFARAPGIDHNLRVGRDMHRSGAQVSIPLPPRVCRCQHGSVARTTNGKRLVGQGVVREMVEYTRPWAGDVGHSTPGQGSDVVTSSPGLNFEVGTMTLVFASSATLVISTPLGDSSTMKTNSTACRGPDYDRLVCVRDGTQGETLLT